MTMPTDAILTSDGAIYEPDWIRLIKESGIPDDLASNAIKDIERGLRDKLATDPDLPPLKLKTARDILEATYPDPVWIVPGLLPEGLAMLGAPMKIGKSILLMQLACAVATGGMFFDKPVSQGRVLYLDLEGSEPELQDRMRTQKWALEGASNVDIIHIDQFTDELGALTGDGLAKLERMIAFMGYILIQVDTLSISMIGSHDIHDPKHYGVTTSLLRGLHRIAQTYHCCILCTGHHTKGMIRGTYEPDPLIDLLGNVGVGGTVHTAWGIYKQAGKQERRLIVKSRIFKTDSIDLAVQIDPLTYAWQALGEWGEDEPNSRKGRILDALVKIKTQGESSPTQGELATEVGIATSNLSHLIDELVADGQVIVKRESRKKLITLV